MPDTLRFKLADAPAEFEAIHRLNYRTFVQEIPQHPPNDEGRLVDRFHGENTYAICLDGNQLVGMIAGRCQRPFSLDAKVPGLDALLPPHEKVVEVRLLAVEPSHRQHSVFARLAGVLARHFRGQGCDLALISGTVRQTRLYRHLGFQPLGPLVGDEKARFQPMMMTLPDYAPRATHLEVLAGRPAMQLQPGPVALRAPVQAALCLPLLSHRSGEFALLMQRVRARLRALCQAQDVLLLPGNGTLANDAIAAQLAAEPRPGLILCNGEFGERLIDHARRWHLPFNTLQVPWGQAFETTQLLDALARAQPAWVWMVACETSTGVRNALELPLAWCRETGARLCVDAVSALGLAALDLSGVHLASGVSGKALGACAGLALVAHDGRLVGTGRVPRSLDLAAYQAADSVPYTQPSTLIAALDAALDIDWPARWQRVATSDAGLRRALRAKGFAIVADDVHAMPGVITLNCGPDVSASRLARRMARSGYQLAAGSDYLLIRNWLQVCLMGEWDDAALQALPDILGHHVKACRTLGAAQGPRRGSVN